MSLLGQGKAAPKKTKVRSRSSSTAAMNAIYRVWSPVNRIDRSCAQKQS